MADRTMFTKLGQGEPAARTHAPQAARRLELELREQAGDNAQAAREWVPAYVPAPEPERMTPLPLADKALVEPLEAPRPFTVSNDVASATEDGAPVNISVLGNDVGAAAVARINGVAVTPGNIITLQSGARVVVNANGTLSYEVGTAFQSLAAGQTAQDVFTYAASDGGGSPIAPEGVFNAAAINGTNGFVIHGAAAGDRSGYSVAGIGDVNGDGRDDLLISALSADLPGRIDAGVSYVVYGRQGGFGASIDLGGLTAATGFTITGVNAFDFSGASARAAGDVNGDGLADFIIGAPWGEATQGTNAGESYLVFGRQGGFGTGLDLATLDGTNGVTFRGVASGDGLGFAVSAAGDINGDGFDDLILGAREANGPDEADSGASYVVFGRAGGFTAAFDVAGLTGTNGFAIIGADATDRSGYSVAAAGDVNGDGIDDLIIGAPQGDPGGRANAGEAYVVFGRLGGFGASLDLGTLSGTNGFTISGVDAGDHAGWSVASAGDLNGDGRADMVIGALYADPAGRESAGETYVVFGRAGGFGANLDLSSMPASMGFTITGTAAANLTGHSVASAGDINGDGIDDLLIGAIYADGTGGVDAGETYVVFGRTTGFGGMLDLASLNGQTGFAIGGLAAGDFSGQSVSAAGDVNGDGFDDLIIGAPMADPSGRADAGSSYVIFGAANTKGGTDVQTIFVNVGNAPEAPVITSNGGGATGGYTIVEGTLGPNPITAVDPDVPSILTYSIIGGADAALFTINASGVLSLISPPDFEAPADQNDDNVYEVIVQASDGQLTDTQTINVTVTNANEAPVITSNGGGANGTVSIAEGTGTATTVAAVDPDAGAQITYSITGGADAALFSIDAATGVVSFLAPPDFETPLDAGADNNYDIVVQASDGVNTDTQNLRVTVTDVAENTLSLTDVVGLLAVNEGAPFVLIDADVTFTDAGVSYDGGLLTITGLLTTDLITVRNVGTGLGQISIQQAGTIFFEGVDIGTIAQTGNVFSVLFNANPNSAAIEALIEALEYRSTSDVSVPPHNLALKISNSLGQSSATVMVQVQFTADILNGTAGNDILEGLRGNDVINGFDGLDTLFGGAGNDTLFGGNGNDSLDGGVADDTLFGDDGDDTLNGGDGRDRLFGNALNDILNGDGSDDFLDGGSGDDTLNGGGEDDRLLGGVGNDTLDGGDGHDRLDGGDGSDIMAGGTGHDLLTGGAGVDTMRGGDGDDQLDGGADNDEIRGEGGIDTAIFKGQFSSYTVAFITAGVVQVTGPDGSDLVFGCEFLQFDDQIVSLTPAGNNLTPAANNEPPRITSDGGGIEVAIDINEGQTAVTTVVATDLFPGAVTYSLFGGADAARFTIDAATGALTFITAPDFEAPTDAGRDNTYDVIVSASDGQFSDLQGITVTVLDISDAPIPSTKGGGPEICYGPDDDGGDTGAPQVLPGMSDKTVLPPVVDDWADLREARDFFPQESSYERTLPSADPLQQPPITPWDDGFA